MFGNPHIPATGWISISFRAQLNGDFRLNFFSPRVASALVFTMRKSAENSSEHLCCAFVCNWAEFIWKNKKMRLIPFPPVCFWNARQGDHCHSWGDHSPARDTAGSGQLQHKWGWSKQQMVQRGDWEYHRAIFPGVSQQLMAALGWESRVSNCWQMTVTTSHAYIGVKYFPSHPTPSLCSLLSLSILTSEEYISLLCLAGSFGTTSSPQMLPHLLFGAAFHVQSVNDVADGPSHVLSHISLLKRSW